MRKITLAAAAALTAASAMAASPVAAKVDAKPVSAKKVVMETKQAVARFDVNAALTGSRAATATNLPLYTTPGSFYLGMDSQGYTYTSKGGGAYFFSLIAPAAKVRYVSTAQDANPTWNWEEFVINEAGDGLEPAARTGAGNVLEVETSAYTQFNGGISYTGTIGGSELTWANPALGIMAGRSFGDWGLKGNDGAMFGATPAAAPTEGFFRGSDMFQVDRTGATGYNKFGVNTEFAADEWQEQGIDPETVQIDAFATYLPAGSAPFQLRGLYFPAIYISTEDMPLTISVYNVDEEGNPDMSVAVGGGEVVLPASAEATSDIPYVEIKSKNILGYTSDAPVVSNGTNELYITIEGFNAEFVKMFAIPVDMCSKVPVADWGGDNFNFYRRAYPKNMDMRYSGKNANTGETVELSCPHLHAYGDSKDRTIYWMTTDFSIYYDIYFPCIFPAFVDQTFDVEIPAEGGEGLCPIDGYTGLDSDIAQLWEDAIIDGEVSDDWISYEVAYSEADELSYVAVSADALPAGEVGRTGTIKFTGYGCDFTITVNQGEVSGINSVAAAANGNVEFFDLQGRKLGAAPANGLYIERNGNTAATKLAR